MKLTYRLATESDLIEIVRMLSDDELGAKRENFQLPLPDAYRRAFQIIANDPHQELTIAELHGECGHVSIELYSIPDVSGGHSGADRSGSR